LTLVGAGGVGKTRLALAVGAHLADRFRDGVVFVPLASLREPELVLAAIARHAGLREGAEPLADALRDHLAGRSMLLILDDLEHLLTAAPQVAALTASAPRLHVLCTSRSPLRVHGERVVTVGPLPVEAARQLFMERAIQAGLPPTAVEADGPAVTEVCRRVDGLPLALELAAARTGVLPVPALDGPRQFV